MEDDIFESIRRTHEMMNRMRSPFQQFQKQLDIIRQPIIEQALAAQQAFEPLFDQIQIAQKSLGPMIEAVHRQQEFIKAATAGITINDSLLKNQELTAAIDKIANLRLPYTPVPQNVYPKLQELLIAAIPDNTEEDHSELESTLTVRHSDSNIMERKLTWADVINILLVVLTIIQAQFNDYQNNVKDEIQHHEVMDELRIQTNIQEQQLKIETEQLEIDQAKLEALNSFLEFMEPYVPNDSDSPETDSEEPPVVD